MPLAKAITLAKLAKIANTASAAQKTVSPAAFAKSKNGRLITIDLIHLTSYLMNTQQPNNGAH